MVVMVVMVVVTVVVMAGGGGVPSCSRKPQETRSHVYASIHSSIQ